MASTDGMAFSEALQHAQSAPSYLDKGKGQLSPFPLPFLSTTESTELWMKYESMMLSCLRTEDDRSAHLCLERLTQRFGASNERVTGLRGLYQEAVAQDKKDLEKLLKEYDEILVKEPTNLAIMKRYITLFESLETPSEAISALVGLLESSPTDVEAWAELSDLYVSQAMYSQACFCLEEAILIVPNAWNIHARLGEILYMSSSGKVDASDARSERALIDAMQRFCRSVELCDGYLRGYYGLKTATDRLLELFRSGTRRGNTITTTDGSENTVPSTERVEKLSQLATTRIAEILRRNKGGDVDFSGYNEAEIAAAKELLDGNTLSIPR